MKILVIDDESPILESIAYNLRKEGYEVLTADDAGEGLARAKRDSPDLIILDVMLPSGSGLDVCRVLRAESPVPMILLTARTGEMDRVAGLEIGADDYVTKPFSMRELMARVKNILRRGALGEDALPWKTIRAGDIEIDSARHEVRVSGQPVNLTPKEFDLLHFLAANPDRVLSRERLLNRVWGPDAYVGDKTIDVHIRWLREKVETNPGNPRRILTVRGVGYKLTTT